MTSLVAPPRPRLIVAPRVPAAPKVHTGNPFTSDGDVIADCETPKEDGSRCGWHAMGPRAEVKKAVALHNRMYHSESTAVVLLNQARQ